MSRPLAAASAARSRASPAFSPRKSRVSRPVAGAYKRATAAPATAPSKNARRMLPAPAPSSRAMVGLLEDADFHVQVAFRISLDLGQQRLEFDHRFVHVLI